MVEMDMLTWSLAAISVVAGAGVYYVVCVLGPAEQKGKRAAELGGGSIAREGVADNYREYAAFFKRPKQIATPDRVPNLVDTFYNLVTDIYEWGWGQSFHFSPAIPGKSHREETRIHEERVADILKIKPGDRVLDAGCGVGGPMRAIAAYSRANIVGITINDYQAFRAYLNPCNNPHLEDRIADILDIKSGDKVLDSGCGVGGPMRAIAAHSRALVVGITISDCQVTRARSHNKKAGLDGLCEVVCGNFLHMPFEDNSFDGAYSIEATCHAPELKEVYSEIYRVLKPEQLYVTYEWVTTPKYRAEDPEHVEIIHGIEHGDALPGLRNYKQIVEVAKEVGFEVLEERDLALPPAHPWWERLKMGRFAYYRNHIVISVLSFLGIAPQGVVDVHEMLFKTAGYLTRGGDTGIFTPMHLLVCRKPRT